MSKRRLVAASIVGVVVVAWLVIPKVVSQYKPSSENMSPTIELGDQVLARSIDGGDVSRGDTPEI